MTDAPLERGAAGWWGSLRRRKVVQWGVVYVAAAWGFLQGLEYVSEAFHWPDQLRQIALIALLIGLPVVLVLAWYHGDRGQQRITTPEFAILTLLLLLGGGAFWYYQRTAEVVKDAVPTASPAQPDALVIKDARPSVAVLPFENRSREEDDAFFVDGVHDDILTQLSKVSALRVISRTSVEQFRDTKLPMKAIADQLGVTKILEGGVQRAGDRVRINVQLIDAGTDAHLWAESYDREINAASIFAIQSEVAAAIAGALKATLSGDEKARVDAVPTQNLEAWEAYQLGRQRMAKRTSAALTDAEQFFRKATDLDPKFALAWTGLADTFQLQAAYSGAPVDVALARAEKAVAEALKLDPNLAEAWAARGGIAMDRAQIEIGERFLRRAIEINPNYAPAHHWLSMVIRGTGELQEAYEHAERAVQLDPLSALTNSNLAFCFQTLGRFDEAVTRYRRAIDIDPMFPPAFEGLAMQEAYARNRFADAVPIMARAVDLDSSSPVLASELALLRLDIDDGPEATRLITAAIQRWPDDVNTNVYAARVFSALGESAAAEKHARKAFAAYAREPWSIRVLRNADLGKGDVKAARARYESVYPEFLKSPTPHVVWGNHIAAIDFALVMQKAGELDKASNLLNRSELAIRPLPRLGWAGYGIADVQIHALRGEQSKSLSALREAERAGWRGPLWRYYRDHDPNLDSIRNEPEFKAVFTDIERDMAQQRAALAARPKDAPLDIAETGT